jgi:hypothetical protein
MDKITITVVRYKNIFSSSAYVAGVVGNLTFRYATGDTRAEAIGYFVESNLDSLADHMIDSVVVVEARDSAHAESILKPKT